MKKFISLRNPSLFLFSLCFSLGINSALAAPLYIMGDPVFQLGAEALSLGGAALTTKSTHDNLLLNPAAGAFSKEYAIDATFSTALRTLSASVFDTKSSEYGGGIYYIRKEVESGDLDKPLMSGSLEHKYQSFGVSLFGKLVEQFAVGITGRYSMRDGTGTANKDDKSFNGDVGAVYKLNDEFSVGALYKNLLGDKKNLEARSISGGAHYKVIPELTISGVVEKYSATTGDAEIDIPEDGNLVWSLGGEYKHASGVALRAGYRDAAAWKHQLAFGGVSYEKDMVRVAYAFGTVVGGDGKKFTLHTFGLGASF